MKKSSRGSSKAWNYGKCNPDPLPGWPRRSPLTTEPHIDYSGSQIPHPITGFMWIPYLPVRDRTQTGTRRTACYEPRNRNQHSPRRVISAPFALKTPSVTKDEDSTPFCSQHIVSSCAGPVHRNPLAPSMMCPSSLDTQGRIPYARAC